MASYDDTATVSGSVAHISDGAAKVPVDSCVVSLAASLSGYTEANVNVTGKNLLNPTTCQRGWIAGKGVIQSPGATTQELYSDFIKVKPNTSYTFSATVNNSSEKWRGFGFYDKNKNFISRNAAASGTGESFSITATTPNNAYYLRCTWRNYSDISSGGSVCVCQCEEGSATAYEAYKNTIKSANLGRAIYGGQADIVTGEGSDNCKRIQIKDRTWTITEVGSSFQVFTCNKITNKATNFNFQVEGYENAETYRNYLQDKQCGTYNTTNDMDRIVIRDDSYANVEDFLTAKGDNYIVYESTDTPTDFTFDGQTIETSGEVENWWTDSDISVSYHDNAHGFASVTVNRAKKNLLPLAVDYENYESEKNSMTCTILSDGRVKFNGTTTANTDFIFYSYSSSNSPKLYVPKGKYTFSNIGNNNVKMVVSGAGNNGFSYREFANGSWTSTVTDETKPFNYVVFRISSGVTLDNVVIEPMLEEGESASSFEPYVAPTSKTAYLHKVIYGGLVDVIAGTAKPKNLFDSADASHTFTSGENAQYQLGTIALKGGVTYTFSAYQEDALTSNTRNTLVIYDNGNYTYEYGTGTNYHNESGVHSMQYTPNADTTVTLIVWVHTPSNDVTYSEFQVEKGSSVSDFAPYFDPFTFTPVTMDTEVGENTLYANKGNSAIIYRKEST